MLPKFRSDLEIIPGIREEGGMKYLLKDPKTNEVFELDEKTFFLCQQMNGENSITDIISLLQRKFHESFSLQQFQALTYQLQANGLLVAKIIQPHIIWHPSTYFLKYRIGRPIKLINLLTACFNWCFTPLFPWIFCCLALISLLIIINNYYQFFLEAQDLLNPGPFFFETLLGFLVVNTTAEFGKAIGCKRFLGTVPQLYFGLMYRIIPHLYFAIDEPFWVLKKKQRQRVLKAGLLAQLLIWNIGIIAWKITAVGSGIHFCWMVFNFAALIFFLLNAIPLITKDGYFWLSNWWEFPDLFYRARNYVLSWMFRKSPPEPFASRKRLGVLWYGGLSLFYEAAFWLAILLLQCYLFIWGWNLQGIGFFLSVVLLLVVFEDFFKRQAFRIPGVKLMFRSESGKITVKTGVKIGLLAAFIILLFLPYPFDAGGNFKLLPKDQLSIRAVVPGEIEAIYFKEGENVKKGQILAKLLDKDQQAKAARAKETLKEAMEKLALMKSGAKPEMIAKAEQEVKLAQTALTFSKVEADRYTKMFKEKAVTDEDLQHRLRIKEENYDKLILAQKNLEVVKNPFRPEEIRAQEAQVRSAQAELVLAEKDLELTIITSPMDGWFITAYPAQKVGQYLEPGELLGVVECTKDRIAEIEVPENDIEEVKIGAQVKLRPWAFPGKTFYGRVIAIAPVGYEETRHKVERVLTEKEYRQMPVIPEQNKVIRVLSEVPDGLNLLYTEMTGYAKIEGSWQPVGLAFTRWLVRFVMVTIWSWIP
jgi:putative peptide zinc metalloprotease protein